MLCVCVMCLRGVCVCGVLCVVCVSYVCVCVSVCVAGCNSWYSLTVVIPLGFVCVLKILAVWLRQIFWMCCEGCGGDGDVTGLGCVVKIL